MPTKVKFCKSILYDHVNWPIGSVCMMEDTKATYLVGTLVCELTTEPLSERPAPLVVRSNNSAKETGDAIAEALKGAFTQKPDIVTKPAPALAASGAKV